MRSLGKEFFMSLITTITKLITEKLREKEPFQFPKHFRCICLICLLLRHLQHLLCLLLQALSNAGLWPECHAALLEAGAADALLSLLLPEDSYYYTAQVREYLSTVHAST